MVPRCLIQMFIWRVPAFNDTSQERSASKLGTVTLSNHEVRHEFVTNKGEGFIIFRKSGRVCLGKGIPNGDQTSCWQGLLCKKDWARRLDPMSFTSESSYESC